jgi:hypothetical protein
MIKLVKFLLPVCILLLSSSAQQREPVYYGSVCSSLIKNLNETASSACYSGTIGFQESIFCSALSDTERENSLNHQASFEEKEDELAFFKRFAAFSNDFVAAFYTYTPASYSQCAIRSLYFFKPFSYFSTYRSLYLRFKVLRI